MANLANCKRHVARVSTVATYSANEPFQIPLLRTKNHTVVRGKLTVNYTASSATVKEDGLAKLVKGLALQVNLGPKLCEVQDLSQLVLYNQHLNRGRLTHNQPDDTDGSHTGYVEFEFNLPLNREDPYDASVCIPAQAAEISDIHLVGTWGTASDIGSGITVDSAQIEITESYGWMCTEEGFRANFPPEQRLMPNWYFGVQTFTGAVANFGQTLNLRPNVVIRNIFLVIKDSNGNRSNSVVSEFAIKLYDNTYVFGPFDFTDYQARMADSLDMDPITGCILIDCTQFDKEFCTPVGIQLEKTGDMWIEYTTTAAGSVTWLFDAVLLRPSLI